MNNQKILVKLVIIILLSIGFNHLISQPNTKLIDKYLQQGLQAMDNANYEKAIEHYNEATALGVEFATPYYNRGLAYFELRQFEDALNDFDQAQQNLSEKDLVSLKEASIMRGRSLYLLKRFDEALEIYNTILEKESDDATVLNDRGITYWKQKKHQEALVDLQKAIALDSKFAIAYCNIGSLKNELGQSNEGLNFINKALELEEDFSLALSNRSIIYRGFKKYDLAIKDLTQAIAINNEWGIESGIWDAYYNRASTYMELGKLADALKDIETAIDLQPDKAYLLDLKGRLLIELGQLKEGLKVYSKALKKVKKEDIDIKATLLYNRAFLFQKLGAYSQALTDIEEGLKLDQQSKDGLAKRGQLYLEQQAFSQAISDLSGSIEQGNDDPIVYFNRAMAYTQSGQYGKAMQDFFTLAKLPKANELAANLWETVYLNRAFIKQNLGDLEGALEDYEKVISINSNYSLAYANRATIYMQIKEYEDAIEDLNAAITINQNWGTLKMSGVYYNRSVAKLEIGEFEEAIEDINIAIKEEPENLNYYFNRSMGYYYLKQYTKAKTDLEFILSKEPNFPNAQTNLQAVKSRM